MQSLGHALGLLPQVILAILGSRMQPRTSFCKMGYLLFISSYAGEMGHSYLFCPGHDQGKLMQLRMLHVSLYRLAMYGKPLRLLMGTYPTQVGEVVHKHRASLDAVADRSRGPNSKTSELS